MSVNKKKQVEMLDRTVVKAYRELAVLFPDCGKRVLLYSEEASESWLKNRFVGFQMVL